MSNTLPSLKIGSAAIKRNKFNISSVSRYTCNFGAFQPTFYRNMIPNETVTVQDTSIIQLADMPVQTMADMSLRTYHFFVPYRCVYRNFDSMLSGNTVNTPNGAFVPTQVPYTYMNLIAKYVMGYLYNQELSNQYFISYDTEGRTLVNCGKKADGTADTEFISSIDSDTCDIDPQTGFYLRYTEKAKRLISIIQGFGFHWNPTNQNIKISLIPFLGYVYSYYKYLCPRRDYTFETTKCHKLIEKLHYTNGYIVQGSDLKDIFDECLDCYYTFDADYFTASLNGNTYGISDADTSLFYSPEGKSFYPLLSSESFEYPVGSYQDGGSSGSEVTSGLGVRLAQQVLKYVNRNTYVGRQVENYLKSRYGVKSPAYDYDSPYFIGGDITDINVNGLMSQAGTEEANLGHRGAYGSGGGQNKKFSFTSKEFGIWISMSAVVPHARYWQGYDKANSATDPLDFFTPEFDGVGYQGIRMSEVNTFATLPNSTFGYVPTYLHLKVGHDIMNGMFSYPSTRKAGMGNYDLDRTFPGGLNPDKWSFCRAMNHDSLENTEEVAYERIFTDTTPFVDHFYIRTQHDAMSIAPMKTYSQSIDVQKESDDFDINYV